MKQFEIWIANLKGDGSVQNGKRPVIITQNNTGNAFSPTTIVVPVTNANKNKLPTHFDITSGDVTGIALCEQIVCINKYEIISKVGELNQNDIDKLKQCISISLGL